MSDKNVQYLFYEGNNNNNNSYNNDNNNNDNNKKNNNNDNNNDNNKNNKNNNNNNNKNNSNLESHETKASSTNESTQQQKDNSKTNRISKKCHNIKNFTRNDKDYNFLSPPENSNMEKNIFHAFCVVFIYIFLSTNSMEEDENLKQILTDFKIDSSNIDAIEELLPKEIKEINKKNKQLNISFEYNEDNLKNIFNYLKNNYKEFYIELLEKMLYVPFFLVSELPTEYTYNLYL